MTAKLTLVAPVESTEGWILQSDPDFSEADLAAVGGHGGDVS